MALPCLLLVAAASVGCSKRADESVGAPSGSGSAARGIAAPPSASSPPTERTVASAKAEDPAEPAEEPPERPTPGEGPGAAAWIVDEPADVGPAGPASAAEEGVVMVSRSGELWLSPLGAVARAPKPGRTRLEPVAAVESEGFVHGPGPAVVEGRAYYVHRSKLWRRGTLKGGPPQALADGARDGTRVSALAWKTAGSARGAAARHAVAFIAEEGSRLVAKLWLEGSPALLLTPEGSMTSTVSLAQAGPVLLAISLEGRTGMSPLHARAVTLTGSQPSLGEDVVVWVGGTAQRTTEVTALGTDRDGAWAFLPLERDITHFGLARISIDRVPGMDNQATWRTYPNGIDPAPTAPGSLCGERVVVYARPSDSAPGSPQELHLSRLGPTGLSASQTVAYAVTFANVSLAPIDGGALVVYTADGRTWALTVRCPVALGSESPQPPGPHRR